MPMWTRQPQKHQAPHSDNSPHHNAAISSLILATLAIATTLFHYATRPGERSKHSIHWQRATCEFVST